MSREVVTMTAAELLNELKHSRPVVWCDTFDCFIDAKKTEVKEQLEWFVNNSSVDRRFYVRSSWDGRLAFIRKAR